MDFRKQKKQIPRQDSLLICGRKPQGIDLGKFDFRIQPGTVRAKEDFVRSCALDGILEQAKTAHAGRIRVDIGVARERSDEGDLGTPVVREAAEVRDDEVHFGILHRE